MKTFRSFQAALIVAGAVTSTQVSAHGAHDADSVSAAHNQPCTVLYTNAAYTHAIHGSPNPAPEAVIGTVATVYVSQAAGPAIYSYGGAGEVTAMDAAREVCQR